MQDTTHCVFNASFVNEQTRQTDDECTQQRPVRPISIEKSADAVHVDVIIVYSQDTYKRLHLLIGRVRAI